MHLYNFKQPLMCCDECGSEWLFETALKQLIAGRDYSITADHPLTLKGYRITEVDTLRSREIRILACPCGRNFAPPPSAVDPPWAQAQAYHLWTTLLETAPGKMRAIEVEAALLVEECDWAVDGLTEVQQRLEELERVVFKTFRARLSRLFRDRRRPWQELTPRPTDGARDVLTKALQEVGYTHRKARDLVTAVVAAMRNVLRRHGSLELPVGTISIVQAPQRQERVLRGVKQVLYSLPRRVRFRPSVDFEAEPDKREEQTPPANTKQLLQKGEDDMANFKLACPTCGSPWFSEIDLNQYCGMSTINIAESTWAKWEEPVRAYRCPCGEVFVLPGYSNQGEAAKRRASATASVDNAMARRRESLVELAQAKRKLEGDPTLKVVRSLQRRLDALDSLVTEMRGMLPATRQKRSGRPPAEKPAGGAGGDQSETLRESRDVDPDASPPET